MNIFLDVSTRARRPLKEFMPPGGTFHPDNLCQPDIFQHI